jgi:hypothetical protein
MALRLNQGRVCVRERERESESERESERVISRNYVQLTANNDDHMLDLSSMDGGSEHKQ